MAGAPGRGTLEKDKPPVLGLIQRGGQVVLHMLANVQQRTMKQSVGKTHQRRCCMDPRVALQVGLT